MCVRACVRACVGNHPLPFKCFQGPRKAPPPQKKKDTATLSAHAIVTSLAVAALPLLTFGRCLASGGQVSVRRLAAFLAADEIQPYISRTGHGAAPDDDRAAPTASTSGGGHGGNVGGSVGGRGSVASSGRGPSKAPRGTVFLGAGDYTWGRPHAHARASGAEDDDAVGEEPVSSNAEITWLHSPSIAFLKLHTDSPHIAVVVSSSMVPAVHNH